MPRLNTDVALPHRVSPPERPSRLRRRLGKHRLQSVTGLAPKLGSHLPEMVIPKQTELVEVLLEFLPAEPRQRIPQACLSRCPCDQRPTFGAEPIQPGRVRRPLLQRQEWVRRRLRQPRDPFPDLLRSQPLEHGLGLGLTNAPVRRLDPREGGRDRLGPLPPKTDGQPLARLAVLRRGVRLQHLALAPLRAPRMDDPVTLPK